MTILLDDDHENPDIWHVTANGKRTGYRVVTQYVDDGDYDLLVDPIGHVVLFDPSFSEVAAYVDEQLRGEPEAA